MSKCLLAKNRRELKTLLARQRARSGRDGWAGDLLDTWKAPRPAHMLAWRLRRLRPNLFADLRAVSRALPPLTL